MSMDAIGIAYGSNKSSLRADYLIHYERLLAPFGDAEINLIEIGAQDGASLRLWQACFRRATIIGLDINPNCRALAGGRIVVEIGSQDDPEFLQAIAAKYPPTIVIDDGSHRSDHQIASFEALFPLLIAGGCYVIEDLSSSPAYRGTAAVSGPDYFSRLQLAVMTRWEAGRDLVPSWAPLLIARSETWPGVAAFWKKPAARDLAIDVAMLEDLSERSGGLGVLDLAWYLENRVGALDAALAVARRGVDMHPTNPWHHLQLGEILAKQGDLQGARAAAQRAVDLKPDVAFFQERLRIFGG